MTEHVECEPHGNGLGRDRPLAARRLLRGRVVLDAERVRRNRLMAAVTGGEGATVRELVAAGHDGRTRREE